MVFSNIFKIKKRAKGEENREKEKQKKISKEKDQKTEKEEKKVSKKNKEAKPKIAWRFLKFPQITEKATKLAEENQYTFKVLPESNKTEIKKAIEELYGVNVLSVKIINTKSKKRRLGRILGKKSGYKKAIVKIKEGQKIEVLPR